MMRSLFIATTLVFISATSMAQVLFVKKEFCRKKEVELLSGNKIPANYVIVGVGAIQREETLDSIEKLTQKHTNKMKRYGRMFKSCHVFVDFEGEIMVLTDKDGNDLHKKEISFYILQPYIECKKPDEQ